MQLTKGVMASLRTNRVTFTMEQIVLVTKPPIVRTAVPVNLDLQTKAIGVFVLLVSPVKSVKKILTNVHQTNTTAVKMQCVTIRKDRLTVPANQGLLVTDTNVQTSTNVQLEHVIVVIMPCVTTPKEDTTVHANSASQVMDGTVQILTSVQQTNATAVIMQCVTTLRDHSTVPANQGFLVTDTNVKILMNVSKDLMTATLALLLAQILLDHTAVLVTLDMKETERQAAIGFQNVVNIKVSAAKTGRYPVVTALNVTKILVLGGIGLMEQQGQEWQLHVHLKIDVIRT